MRNAFARTMTELAKERNDVCLLSGDIGNKMFDNYKQIAKERFLNCGIAEANMMSMAAGMALSGLRPVVYTIAPFTTTRCLEQIRTGVAYHEAPVVIVGTGSGLSYAELGPSHHSLEDIAILRSIPNMQICAPADSRELEAHLRQAIDEEKPTYIRIGKKGEPDLIGKNEAIRIGKANLIKEGERTIVMGIGPILTEAIKARESLLNEGIKLAVASMGTIKPIDEHFLLDCIKNGYEHWITLEEHSRIGGLGSKITEWIAENEIKNIKITRIGSKDKFLHELGNQEYIRTKMNIDQSSIVRAAKK